MGIHDEYDYQRMEEIKEQIKELLQEAKDIVRSHSRNDSSMYERARGYWLAQIETALDSEHGWLGGCMFTMQHTIDEIESKEMALDEEEDEEDEE